MLVWSLGLEDPLEQEIAIHSSVCAWKIPWINPWAQALATPHHFPQAPGQSIPPPGFWLNATLRIFRRKAG